MKVVGIDPSKRSTGIVLIDNDWQITTSALVRESGPEWKVYLKQIAAVIEVCTGADIAFVENAAYGFGGSSSSVVELAHISGSIRAALSTRLVPWLPIANATWKRAVMGEGNGKFDSKALTDEQHAYLESRFGKLPEQADLRDAYLIACGGRVCLESPGTKGMARIAEAYRAISKQMDAERLRRIGGDT